MMLSQRPDLPAAKAFFGRALEVGVTPREVTTDRAPAFPQLLDEYVPTALHIVEQYANNPIEADHGRLKARLRPMGGLKRFRSAQTLAAGHAFIQNLRRATTNSPPTNRLACGSGSPSTRSPPPSETLASQGLPRPRPANATLPRVDACARIGEGPHPVSAVVGTCSFQMI
jgi:hypothetical protein